MAHEHVAAGIAAALAVGALTADAVALEARKITQLDSESGSPLTERSPALALMDEPGVVSPSRRGRATVSWCGRKALTMTVPRHRGLTEQAADTAVDQACKMLRLPTIRQSYAATAQQASS